MTSVSGAHSRMEHNSLLLAMFLLGQIAPQDGDFRISQFSPFIGVFFLLLTQHNNQQNRAAGIWQRPLYA